MEQNNTEILLQMIEDIFSEGNSEGLTEDKFEMLSNYIPDDTTLAQTLPLLRDLVAIYKTNTGKSDEKVKEYTVSKKMWKTREEQITEFVGFVLQKLGHKSYTAGDTKASIQTREVLEISDEDAILAQYLNSAEYGILRTLLPGWVKMTLTIDKTALKSYVKTDSSLLCSHPEWVRTKENVTVNLK